MMCPQCGHDIQTPGYCDYCQMFLNENPALLAGFDKRSASVMHLTFNGVFSYAST